MGEFAAHEATDGIMNRLAAEKTLRSTPASPRASPARAAQMVVLLGDLHHALLATLNNATELGTLCNIEQAVYAAHEKSSPRTKPPR